MFKRILLPVDGTLSMVPRVRKCLAFAAEIGAHVTAIHVVSGSSQGSFGPTGMACVAATDELLPRALRILQDIESEARALAVPCNCQLLAGDEPWRVIVQAALNNGADLICMGSHGRPGGSEHLLPSQTKRVLEHTQLPVLLFH